MKKTGSLVAVLLLTLLACGAGCGKKAGSGQKPQTLEEGMAQFQAAVMSASPESQSNFFNTVATGIRYGNYGEALQMMDHIAADPSLNADSKKIAGDLIELLKTAAQNQPAAPAPAQ